MSQSLGDFFSAVQKFKVGNIYHIRLFSNDGITLQAGAKFRDKFVIIIGHDSNNNAIGVILINSIINPINFSKGLHHLHKPLDVVKYNSFLDHTSYADCSLLIPLDARRVENCTYKCALDPVDLHLIQQTVQASPTITPKLKKQFGLK